MKKLCLMSLMISAPISAFALQDLDCTYSGLYSPYVVSFESKNGAATVTIDNQSVPFGSLHCREANRLFGLVATCHSDGVADAGYNVHLYRDKDNTHSIDLYENSFMGSSLLASLPCWLRPNS